MTEKYCDNCFYHDDNVLVTRIQNKYPSTVLCIIHDTLVSKSHVCPSWKREVK